MERHELIDKIQEIQDKNYNLFKGVNEADLATREEIADLFEQILKERASVDSSDELSGLHKHFVNARFDDSDEEDENFEEEEPDYKECMCCGNVQQYGMSCNKCAGPTKDGFL